jgi:Ni,Fe-hydrogenase III component G
MSAETLREKIGGNWTERADGWWLRIPADKIREAARTMLAGGARFAALVTRPDGAGQLRLSWHWDLKGALLSVETTLAAGVPAPSIVDIYPGADWAEREAREYYAVTFKGRDSTPPLMLREGDAVGILLGPEGRLQ